MATHDISKPAIVISDANNRLLTTLATNALGTMPELAEEMLSELERATIVPSVPDNVVQIGSRARYRTDDGQQREIVLVLPGQADISAAKVSVFTPIGTALLGLSPGQSMSWVGRDGTMHQLTVLLVTAPGSPAD